MTQDHLPNCGSWPSALLLLAGRWVSSNKFADLLIFFLNLALFQAADSQWNDSYKPTPFGLTSLFSVLLFTCIWKHKVSVEGPMTTFYSASMSQLHELCTWNVSVVNKNYEPTVWSKAGGTLSCISHSFSGDNATTDRSWCYKNWPKSVLHQILMCWWVIFILVIPTWCFDIIHCKLTPWNVKAHSPCNCLMNQIRALEVW